MSNFVAAMTDIDVAQVADNLYCFVQDKGELPDDDLVFELIQNSNDLVDFGHKLNHIFIECMREALLNAVSFSNRDKMRSLLRIEEQFVENEPTESRFTIRFLNRTLDYPEHEVLEDLYWSLSRYEQEMLNTSLNANVAFTLSVPRQVIDKIKEIEDEGIYAPIVDSSCGLSSTHIIELSFLRERIDIKHEYSQRYQAILNVLIEHDKKLATLEESYKPDFLVLYVQNDE